MASNQPRVHQERKPQPSRPSRPSSLCPAKPRRTSQPVKPRSPKRETPRSWRRRKPWNSSRSWLATVRSRLRPTLEIMTIHLSNPEVQEQESPCRTTMKTKVLSVTQPQAAGHPRTKDWTSERVRVHILNRQRSRQPKKLTTKVKRVLDQTNETPESLKQTRKKETPME